MKRIEGSQDVRRGANSEERRARVPWQRPAKMALRLEPKDSHH